MTGTRGIPTATSSNVSSIGSGGHATGWLSLPITMVVTIRRKTGGEVITKPGWRRECGGRSKRGREKRSAEVK